MNNNNTTNSNTKPMIVPLPNGPLYLINDREPKVLEYLVNSKNEKLSNTQGIALCRYGASKNKPFCDGSHNIIGFQTQNVNADNDKSKNKFKSKRNSYVGKNITMHDNRSICSHAAECVKNYLQFSISSVAAQPTTNTNQETSTIVNNSDNTNNQIVTNIPNIMSFENTSFNDFFDPFF